MDKRGKTIGQRINSLVAVAVLIATLIFATVIAAFQVQDSVKARRSALEATGYVYASTAAEALATQDIPALQSVFKSVARLSDVIVVFALDNGGGVLATMGQQTVLTSEMLQGEPSLFKILTSGSMPVSVEVVRGGVPVGSIVLVGNISDIKDQVSKTLVATLLSAIAALFIALFFAHRLQTRVTAPIIELTKSMRALHAAHRYEPAEVVNAEGETRELTDTFNGMIAEIKARDDAMQRLAYFDPQTGLTNRANFQRHLYDREQHEKKHRSSHAVYLIAIENFQAICDTLGSVVGDAVFMSAGALLRDVAGKDMVLSRLSADEFGLMAPDVKTLDDAQQTLAPFVASLFQPLTIMGHQIHVTVAAGIAVSCLHREGGIETFRQAHLALAAAKRAGVGRIESYRPEFAERLQEEIEIERGLRRSLKTKGFEVHFQPIVNAATNKVDGFEALMRWKNGTSGFVPPSKFIPVAERTGLITEMGFWILRRSCMHAKAWIDLGLKPRQISVNVSPGQLMVSGFAEQLRGILRETQLPPHLLCLELTESIFIGRALKNIRALLDEIKALGVKIALDDFGTGYSSLSYLEGLSFDKLKIDRAFVHHKADNANQSHLLKGIIDLAHALNISVVAEGAETAMEVAALKVLGAEAIQGYFFSRPLPEAELFGAVARIEGGLTAAAMA